MGDSKQIFGMVFLLAQRWQVMGDRELKDADMTTKQWLVLVSIQTLFDSPPSLSELAEAMGSSRQNVKQLALNLERKGFLEIRQDPHDARIQRFVLTPKNHQFWQARAGRDEAFIQSLFEGISPEALDVTNQTLAKLLSITSPHFSPNDKREPLS